MSQVSATERVVYRVCRKTGEHLFIFLDRRKAHQFECWSPQNGKGFASIKCLLCPGARAPYSLADQFQFLVENPGCNFKLVTNISTKDFMS